MEMLEIERKFLPNEDTINLVELLKLRNRSSKNMAACYKHWDQAGACDRIRIERCETSGTVEYIQTIKTAKSELSRSEQENPLSASEAVDYLLACDLPPIKKTRIYVPYEHDDSLTWEIDIFGGELSGLILIEIELPSEDYPLVLPDWVGKEVSDDYSYTNVNLYFHREIVRYK